MSTDRRGDSGRPNGRRQESAALLAVLLVAATVVGALAVSEPAAAAPPGNASDATVTTSATLGTAVEVVDVSYATAGTVASVRVDLGRGSDAHNVTASDVSGIDVVLYNDSAGVLARVNGTAYGARTVEVGFGGPVTGVDRVRVVATVADTAEDGDVLDADVALLDGDGDAEPWQSTAGRQPIVAAPNTRLRLEVTDAEGTPICRGTVRIINRDSDTAALTAETSADGQVGPLAFPAGSYTATLVDDRFRVFADRIRLDPGEAGTISVTAERPAPLPGRDLDGDCRNEDVDGDGSFSIVDVAVLLGRFDERAFAENRDRFDFSGDGRLDIVDVAALLALT